MNNENIIVHDSRTIHPFDMIYAKTWRWLITSSSKTQDHPHDLLP